MAKIPYPHYFVFLDFGSFDFGFPNFTAMQDRKMLVPLVTKLFRSGRLVCAYAYASKFRETSFRETILIFKLSQSDPTRLHWFLS